MIPTVFESASGSRLRDSPHRPRGGFRYTRNLCDFAPVFTGFRSVSSDFHLGLGSHAFGRPLKVFFLVTDMIRGMLAAVMRRIPRLEGPASRRAAFFFSFLEPSSNFIHLAPANLAPSVSPPRDIAWPAVQAAATNPAQHSNGTENFSQEHESGH